MMKALSTRNKVALAITVILVLAVVLVTAPILMELQTISKTKDQYIFESAVANEALGRKVNKPNAEEVLKRRRKGDRYIFLINRSVTFCCPITTLRRNYHEEIIPVGCCVRL